MPAPASHVGVSTFPANGPARTSHSRPPYDRATGIESRERTHTPPEEGMESDTDARAPGEGEERGPPDRITGRSPGGGHA
mmetsp:Transcript_8678/g.11506  ORF Transcript_8678/g.11506 Transcript_8678/m.11506 type:complete len:80 (-) Transcript_8678:448-687(-)|eukprot:15324579-Ditylum_brightwellii.AAC.1